MSAYLPPLDGLASSSSIPYSEVEPDAIAPMQIGIVFRCWLLASNCWFNVVEADGGGVRDLGFVNFPFPRARASE